MRRDPVDLGNGLVRVYFAEHSPRRQQPRPARRAIDRREPDPRAALEENAKRTGDSLAALSRLIDRPDHYLSRFVTMGVPGALNPDDHHRLANYFGVDDRGLGVRDLWSR